MYLAELGGNRFGKFSMGFSLSTLPPGKGARVDPEMPGKLLLGDSACLAVADDLLGQRVTLLKWVESEKFDDFGHVIDARGGISLLPIHYRHLIAADDFGDLDLTEVEVQSVFADFLAQRFWSGGVALFLCSIRSPWATNPT